MRGIDLRTVFYKVAGVAIEYKSQHIIRSIEVCIDFKIFKVKVPIIFSGTQGFPARRDRRYHITEILYILDLSRTKFHRLELPICKASKIALGFSCRALWELLYSQPRIW